MDYSRPPITESVIELRFSEEIDFETIVKRSIKFKRNYPNELKNFDVVGEFSEKGVFGKSVEVGLRLSSKDELEVLSINKNSLMVSHLAPYPGWNKFSARFHRDFDLFTELFGRRSFTRAGMRYINRLDVPLGASDERKFINVYPHLPDFGASNTGTFAMTSTFELAEQGLGVTLQSATVESPVPRCTSLVIDIDVFAATDLPMRYDMWEGKLDHMRNVKNEIFERSITAEARRLFS
uniref:TIGR04255 family protein n=1 Tax=uncultured Rhizobium sp. TaxID=155567 RepID=UPI00261EB65D|nr:TIGR04255 family protein [uncultured Rhizobium sp.]